VEFEDHRPIYEWYVNNLDCFPKKPRQIEFAELAVSNTIVGKRFIRPLVADGKVTGWDDPRLVTISGMRRRGYPAAAIRDFLGAAGVSKAKNRVDFAMLEYFVRERLSPAAKVVMAVLNPVKVIIENYPEGQVEMLDMAFHSENEALGSRQVPFSREIYIEREDFMEEPAKKYFRLAPGKEVRLKGAYYITCTGVEKDANGEIAAIRATYDPTTKSGTPGADARKVKGTLHWVSATQAVEITANLYSTLVLDDADAPEGWVENADSLVVRNGYGEPCLAQATPEDRFQFMRNGYFCMDTISGGMVFNRTVGLKSSYKPGAA
jgi:glutaminyl-tRNA synthetase